MIYEINSYELESMLERASELGAAKICSELGLQKSQITQREAFRRFGESRVLRWKKEGKIVPIKSIRTIYYSLVELQRLKAVNELYTHKSTSESEK